VASAVVVYREKFFIPEDIGFAGSCRLIFPQMSLAVSLNVASVG